MPASPDQTAVDRLRVQHAAALHNLKSSFQYRLGDALTSAVTSKAGARKAPRTLLGLAREAWSFKRGQVRAIASWHGEPLRSLHVDSILDEFSDACFAPEMHLRRIKRSETVTYNAALLLAESAWTGNNGAWQYAFSKSDGPAHDALTTLTDDARKAGVPSAFWNKEDPVSFDVFLDAARLFDWVFTTDVQSVATYKRLLGHDRVETLPFAAQTAIHNPIGTQLDTASRFAFAGGWRGDKFPERAAKLREVLEYPRQLGILDVFDRYGDHPTLALRFPSEFAKSIVPPVDFLEMSDTYRSYLGFLNINTVEESETMMSRRVFEILACRTPLISSGAKAIDSMLGDTVLVANTMHQVKQHVDDLLADREHAIRTAHLGYRKVHSEHTYTHRADDMLRAIGLSDTSRASLPAVTVVLVSNRPDKLDNALASFQSQVGVDAKLLFVSNSSRFDHEAVARRVSALGGRYLATDERLTLGECLNQALAMVTTPMWAKFDDDDFYGPHHLHDLLLAHRYTNAAIVGRRSYFVRLAGGELLLRHPDREFQAVTFVAGGSFLADRMQIGDIEFEAVPSGADTRFMRAVREAGMTVFSASKYNYLMNRSSSALDHTWQINEADIMKDATRIACGSPMAYVTV